MSSIDGVGGPKGPGGPGPVSPAEAAAKPEGSDRTFSLDEPGSADASEPAGGAADPVVAEAVERVAGELRAGRISDLPAAFRAVVAEIVEARYPQMPTQQRRQFARHLQDILADDPVLGARITAELERAARA